MSRIEWINCPRCGHKMSRDGLDRLNCEYCERLSFSPADNTLISPYAARDEVFESRAKILRLEWELAIAKTRLRLIRKSAVFIAKTQQIGSSNYDDWLEIIKLVDGTSAELESEIGLDGQPHSLDESEIERRRAWKPY